MENRLRRIWSFDFDQTTLATTVMGLLAAEQLKPTIDRRKCVVKCVTLCSEHNEKRESTANPVINGTLQAREHTW